MKRITIWLALLALALTCFAGCKGKGGGEHTPGSGEDIDDPYANTPISRTEATAPGGESYYEEDALRVVSYNVRCANDKNGNSIAERAMRMDEVLTKYDADVIGFQEVVPEWEGYLDLTLGEDYDYVLKYRSSSNNEGTPVFWKKSKFKLLDSGYFWLSETPDEESKGWGSKYWRILSWVKLEVRQTGTVLYFFNTHFDFDEEPQMGSAKLIISRVKEMCGGAPVFCTADYNMTQSDAAYAEMTTFFTDVNMATVRNMSGTYQAYGEASSLIDFCFVSSSVIPLNYTVMNDRPGGNYVSDHFGICCDVALKHE